MMPEVGITWYGEADPPDEINRPVSRWMTTSENPCSLCAGYNLELFTNPDVVPAHNFCACIMESVEATLELTENVLVGEETEEEPYFYGFAQEEGSGAEGARTVELPDGGSLDVTCERDIWNTTDRCEIYFHYRFILKKYRRRYEFQDPVHGRDHVFEEASSLEVVFLGATVEHA